MRRFELRSLERRDGAYRAVMYNKLGGYYKEHTFIGYDKKSIFHKLRNKYDCTVGRRFTQ